MSFFFLRKLRPTIFLTIKRGAPRLKTIHRFEYHVRYPLLPQK